MDIFDKDYTAQVISGEILPPAGYRINEAGDGLREKTEAEIMATGTGDITGWAEVAGYCRMKADECRRSLADTDYVVAKINELAVEGDSDGVETLRQKYSKQLADRKAWREKINRYEAKLAELDKIGPIF